jgi:hypothetical protein
MERKKRQIPASIKMSDRDYVMGILRANKQLPFVQRILNPGIFPILNNDDGSYSTHSMAWGDGPDGYYVYPTVIQNDDGSMQRLDGRAAWENATKKKQYIKFQHPEDADWFSQNYKAIWDK